MHLSNYLNLPLLIPSQSQKHITHNEAIVKLDSLIQISAADQLDSPPAAPALFSRYIVKADPKNEWTGQAHAIAQFADGIWQFMQPQTGWLCWLESESALYVFQAGGWTPVQNDLEATAQFESLSINTSSDPNNHLSVRGASSLLTADDTGNHRLVLNKTQTSDTASIIYQTGFSGHAELGLAGDNNFKLKLSSDGQNWKTALTANPDTGIINTPGLRSGTITINTDSAADLPWPSKGGFLLIIMSDQLFPQISHSGLFAFDIGPSPSLIPLASASKINIRVNKVLTGTTGVDTYTTLGATSGRLQLENRFGSSRTFSYCFLC